MKIFRKVRQKLAAENSVAKYLRYAIGEIFLVVIGILIALQVNNWNEKEKTQSLSMRFLRLSIRTLQQDSVSLSSELSKTKLAIGLTDSLLKQVKLKNFNNDSLNYWMGKIICFERFRSQSSAYEMLKSKGLENISDKTLQMALISYYDENLFQLYQELNDVEFSFNNDWVPILK